MPNKERRENSITIYNNKISRLNKIAVIIVFGLTCFSATVFCQTTADYNKYISRYYKTAIRQQKKYKIPASIILAQAILESQAGKSYLAKEGNNHFGIKCKTDWKGQSLLKDDNQSQECFRKYKSVWESFEDHSLFLAKRTNYKPLFKLKLTDYKAWAKGLKKCGYATDPKYAAKLIKLIDDYKLYYYDTAKESDPPLVVSLIKKV